MYLKLSTKALPGSRSVREFYVNSTYCVFTLLGLSTGMIHAHVTGVNGSSPAPAPTSSSSLTSVLQLQQLRLQIKLLKQQTSLEAKLQPYIPLLSVVVALTVAGFGAYKYIRDRRRDYALRVEQEVAVNLSYLVEFPKADSSLNARAATALDNLTWLVDKTDDPLRYRQRVTEAIFVEAKDDIDFDDEKQVRFDALCLARWPAYSQFITDQADLQDFILYRYQQAFRVLKKADPVYFSTIRHTADGYHVGHYIKESLYLHFQVLVDGYTQHLELITDPERRARAVDDFVDALGNRTCPFTGSRLDAGIDGGLIF